MSGSNWQTYLAPQIEARNRGMQSKNAAAHHRLPRPPRKSAGQSAGRRLQTVHARVVAAAAVAVAMVLAFFVVLFVQAPPASSQPLPAGHTISSTGHGFGTSWRAE